MSLQLTRLERRLAPSATVSLVSQAADPALTVGASLSRTDVPQRLISADARFTVFDSRAGNVVAGQVDSNNGKDIFLFDRVSNATTLVSRAVDSPVHAGNAQSLNYSLSADGRYVAFQSEATNLIDGFVAGTPTSVNVFVFDRIANSMTAVSHKAGSPLAGANGLSTYPTISQDGRWITFQSNATNLVPGFVPAGAINDLFLYDRLSDVTILVSHDSTSQLKGGTGTSGSALISADGQYLAYRSSAGNLVAGMSGIGGTLFIYNRSTGSNTLVDHAAGKPLTADGASEVAAISADGRFLALQSTAKTLVPGFVDGNGNFGDIYRYDRVTDEMLLVSRSTAGVTGGSNGLHVVSNMTADGRYITFSSTATNLVPGFVDANGGGQDVFLFDCHIGAMTLVSHSAGPSGQSGNRDSRWPVISADGSRIAFSSRATDLVAGFSYGTPTGASWSNVYTFELSTGVIRLASHTSAGPTIGGGTTSWPSLINDDGRWVGFLGASSSFAAGDRNGGPDLFVWDSVSDALLLCSGRKGTQSASAGGDAGGYPSYDHRVTPDGRYVVYSSTAQNVVPGQVDNNNANDVFLLDRQTGVTVLVSRLIGSVNTTGNGVSANPAVSDDGRFVAYDSFATDLVPGFVDNNGNVFSTYTCTDVFLFDRLTGTNVLVSRRFDSPTAGGNDVSGGYFNNFSYPTISADGRYVGYRSQATDLVEGFVDGNGADPQGAGTGNDLYLFDRVTGTNTLVNRAAGTTATGSNGYCYSPMLSADGRYLTYFSVSSDLVAGYVGGKVGNIYSFDRVTGANRLVSHAAGQPLVSCNGSMDPWIAVSADGKFVAFTSTSTNLVTGVTYPNPSTDVFIWDRDADLNNIASRSAGSPFSSANAASATKPGAFSADGRFLVFRSEATDLIAGFVDGNGKFAPDLYVYDRLTGVNTLVSRSATSPTRGGNAETYGGFISGDGRFVAFESEATDLAAGFVLPPPTYLIETEMYLHDRLRGTTDLISHGLSGPTAPASGDSGLSAHGPGSPISHDGSVVLFTSDADNLIVNDFNSFTDLFAYVTPPPRVQSVQLADGSAQRSIIRSLTVIFDQPVFFAGQPAAAFVLTSPVGNVQLAAGSVSGNSVTLTFSGSLTQFGSLVDGKYTLRVLADQVSNIGPLDGNNDGVGGDDFTFNFHRLFGDADGNGFVDAWDFRAFRAAFGSASAVFDLDNDGDTDAADYVAFRGRFGSSV